MRAREHQERGGATDRLVQPEHRVRGRSREEGPRGRVAESPDEERRGLEGEQAEEPEGEQAEGDRDDAQRAEER